jgi:hypothetical protein
MVKYNRPMNFVEKLEAGWWWFGEILFARTMSEDK